MLKIVFLLVLVAAHVFSSGVCVPQLTHQTKIKRPKRAQLIEPIFLKVVVGDKGEVLKIDMWHNFELTLDNTDWVKAAQKEIKKSWKYQPKQRFCMYHMREVYFDVTDADFRPLEPRR